MSGSGPAGNGAIENVSGANTFLGPITLSGGATIGSDADSLTLGGNISAGPNTLTVVGAGTTTINGNILCQGGSVNLAGSGAINTLALSVKSVQLRPTEKTEGKGPDYRVMSGATELGAAWKKTTEDDRSYLSVKLDDPSLPREIFAALFEADEGYHLIWSRPRRRPAKR